MDDNGANDLVALGATLMNFALCNINPLELSIYSLLSLAAQKWYRRVYKPACRMRGTLLCYQQPCVHVVEGYPLRARAFVVNGLP